MTRMSRVGGQSTEICRVRLTRNTKSKRKRDISDMNRLFIVLKQLLDVLTSSSVGDLNDGTLVIKTQMQVIVK